MAGTQTTDRLLTQIANIRAEELLAIYGPRSLKRLISAGIIVLAKLSPEAREKAIAIANGAEDVDLQLGSGTAQNELAELARKVDILANRAGIRFIRPERLGKPELGSEQIEAAQIVAAAEADATKQKQRLPRRHAKSG